MFAILKALQKRFKGEWNELDPLLRIALYFEIGFYLLASFTLLIWQPEFLTE